MHRIFTFPRLSLLIRSFSSKGSKEMKYLNVAEKNDAAKTIAGLLSNGSARRTDGYSVYNKIYTFEATVRGQKSKMVMTSVSGHLLQLEFLTSYRNWKGCDPSQLFDAPVRKTCPEDYQPIRRTLEREIKTCQGLIIWTDCDREGENIGFEIIEICKTVRPNIAVYRAKFSEITGAGVRRALANLAQPDQRQNDAVNVRTELDLRTGAALTRYQTMRMQRLFPEKIADKLISYGSCQIPTLGFVAERYKENEAFVSEPFWKIKVSHTIDELTVDFNWARNRLFDKESCEDYLMLCLADPKAKVENVTTKPKSKWRPVAMDTVEMEKLGSRKLKLSAKETMTIAEKLYSQGYISYPRTETNIFSADINLRGLVEQHLPHPEWGQFASRVMEWGPNPRNGTKSDQAHPPIHPTKFTTGLSGNEARVYELVVRHFLACVSKDATGSETIVNIDVAGEKFQANGLVIYERNYLDVYKYENWNAKRIHHYTIGQEFEPTEISMQEGATTAPPLLTEADLIALMDKHGIGTDATHAEHINTIKERGYIGENNGFLVPGVLGMGLYEGYNAMQIALAKPELRAAFEADLKKICTGEKDPKTVLREQIAKYKDTYKLITEKITAMDERVSNRINEAPRQVAQGASDQTVENRIQEVFKCPKCSVAHMSLKKKKNDTGYYLGCLNFPDCKNAVWLPDEIKEISVSDEQCDRCGPGSKKIKIKFKTVYYRVMFDVPTDFYITCLRCDAKFREAFNINVDQVKRVGAIVGEVGRATSSVTNSVLPANNRDNSNSNLPRNSGNIRPSNDNGPGDKRKTKKKPGDGDGTTTQRPPKKPRVPKNSRTFATMAVAPRDIELRQQEAAEVASLFNLDDGFDELLLGSELDAIESAGTTEPTERSGANTRVMSSSINHDLDSIDFGSWNENDVNDFSDFNWGTSRNSHSHRQIEQGNHSSSQNNGWGTSKNRGPSTSAGDSSNWGTYNTNSRAAITSESHSRPASEQSGRWGTSQTRGSRGNTQTSERTSIWGTSQINPPASSNLWGASHSPDEGTTSWRSKTTPTDQSWGRAGRNNVDEPKNSVKCTGCHQLAKELTVKKDGPNKGRQFFVCSKSNACKFFQWADEVQANPESSPTANPAPSLSGPAQTHSNTPLEDDVMCRCNVLAKSLTVRKDGPNKGRPFYACPNQDKSCGFFKWGDEDSSENVGETSNWGSRNQSSWGSGNQNPSSNFTAMDRRNESSTSAGVRAKRKCGICRLEGHTKAKCPRRDEFPE